MNAPRFWRRRGFVWNSHKTGALYALLVLLAALAGSVASAVLYPVTLTDTVDISDKPSRAQSPKDSLPLASSTAPNGKSVSDTVPLSDSAASPNKPATDTVGISDSPLTDRVAQDSLALDDGAVPDKHVRDTMPLSDSPSVTTTVFYPVAATDTVLLADEPLLDQVARDAVVLLDSSLIETTAFHALAATDTVSILDKSFLDRVAYDTMLLSDSASALANIFYALAPTDTVAITDKPFLDSIAQDMLALSDSASAASFVFQAVTAIDAVAISDAASLFGSAMDALEITDATFLPTVATTSVLGIADAVSRAFGLNIGDTVQVVGQLTEVTAQWYRTFEELFIIFDCTPFACNYVLRLNEGIMLDQDYESVSGTTDVLSVNDSIARSLVSFRSLDGAVAASEQADMMFTPVPPSMPPGIPLPAITYGTSTTVATPLPAEPITGTFTMPSGSPNALAEQLGLPSIDITSAFADMSSVTLMLPTYYIPLASSDGFPADEVMMTPRIAEVPAEMPMFLAIDMAGTPGAQEHEQLSWMELGFTPAVDSTDFAFITAPLDGTPAGAPEPAADVTALYIDFAWVGGFSGPDPSDPSYYSEAPTFTFALSEEWADDNDVERDGNGVPVITLNLLDESTNSWTTVADVDAPLAANGDGEYVYVAHLEHFSSYVITANEDAGGVTPFDTLAVHLTDQLGLSESPQGKAVDIVEEFVGETFAANLLDSVVVSSRPVAYKTLQVGEDVEVLMTVQDIAQASAIMPSAKAVLGITASNAGDKSESFLLKFWYSDESGKRVFESSKEMTVGPRQSVQSTVEIPFSSSGTFSVAVEALSMPDGALLSATQLTVTVPWLVVYLNILLVAAGAILAGSVLGLVLYVKKRDIAR